MIKFIEAIQILSKYGNPDRPLKFEFDILYINDINPEDVSKEDKENLYLLGFFINEEKNLFSSFKYN